MAPSHVILLAIVCVSISLYITMADSLYVCIVIRLIVCQCPFDIRAIIIYARNLQESAGLGDITTRRRRGTTIANV